MLPHPILIYSNDLCCGEVAYGHACRLAASSPRERRMGSSSPTTVREGPEACKPGPRLGPKLTERQVQRTESVSEWHRTPDARLRVVVRNSSVPAQPKPQWAKVLGG